MTQKNADSVNVFEQISQICRDFRKQISQGRSPRIEKYLSAVSDDGSENLFSNLLEIEINFRRSKGQNPTSEEYLKRFSQFAKQVRRAFFEPTMASIDSGDSGDDGTRSLKDAFNASEHTLTFQIPDANRLGDYELMRELGRGGMGVVYEARHTKTNNRVALKTLPTGGRGQDVNAEKLYRFRKEFRRLSEINHPNLVGMQTLEVDGSQWFFTMDLIDGEDFLSYVRQDGELNEQRLRSCLEQLARGVIALHHERIVHRDLKPSNVLVSSDGRVSILDFGLAAEMQRTQDMTQTKSGMFAGTPRYAAPEQMFGERTEASDWYAFGTMLYEALVGEPPFTAKDQIQLLRDKQNLEAASLRDRADLADDLAQIADGLIRRQPDERMNAESVSELLDLNLDTRTGGSTAGSQGSTGSVSGEELDLENLEEEEVVLIGREKQLAQLEEIKQDFLKSVKPKVVWVSGLSGEGKSSLVQKFLRPIRAGDEMLVLSGRCYDRESVPFKAVDGIMDNLVRYLRSGHGKWLESEQPEDMEFLAQVFPLLRRVKWIDERKIQDLARTEPQKIRGRAFFGLRQLLTAICRRTPVVIHIDDLQWGDADSARAWHELLNHNEAPGLLVLGSYRSDEARDSSFLQTWEKLTKSAFHCVSTHSLSVQPLSRSECLALATLRTELPRETIEQEIGQLFQETDGNPYLLDQLLEGFDSESGTIRHVPLNKLIAGRLAQLPEAATRLLEIIAISGQPIRIAEAAAVADSGDATLATLTHMRSERLVRLLDGGIEPQVETWHDKVRESVVAQLRLGRKRALHLKLAEKIERSQEKTADDWLASLRKHSKPGEYDFTPSDRVLDLCRHFSAANDRRAFVYQWLAGEQAMQAYAVEEAYDLFEQALSSLPEDESPSLLFRFWMGLGRVSAWHKSIEQATKAYQNAVEKASDPFEKAEAYAGLERLNMQLGRFGEAIHYIDLAFSELGGKQPKTVLGQLISICLSTFRLFCIPWSWQVAKTEDQRRKARLAHEIFRDGFQAHAETGLISVTYGNSKQMIFALRTGDRAVIAIGSNISAQVWSVFGFSWFGKWFLRRGYQSAKDINDPELAGIRHLYQGIALYWLGHLENSATEFTKSHQLLSRCCRFENLQTAIHMHRHVHAYTGSSSAELEMAHAVLELTTTTGNVQGICWGTYDVACAFARAGELQNSVKYMQKANRTLPPERYTMTSAIRASTDGYIHMQCSDYNSAERLAEYAWSQIHEGWMAIEVSTFCIPVLVESIAGPEWQEPLPAEDRRSLKRALRRAAIFYLTMPNHQPHICRARGRAYWRMGKQRKAVRQFKKAIKLAKKKGMDYQRAKCLLDLAAVQEEGRDESRAEAIRLLKEMESVIPRAESWLLGDQYDEGVVAPEFDLLAWEREHGTIAWLPGDSA